VEPPVAEALPPSPVSLLPPALLLPARAKSFPEFDTAPQASVTSAATLTDAAEIQVFCTEGDLSSYERHGALIATNPDLRLWIFTG
jgi:hypothetical protein